MGLIDPILAALAARQKELLGRFCHKAVPKCNLGLLFAMVLEGLQNWIFKGSQIVPQRYMGLELEDW